MFLGKSVSELQENVKISADNKITGIIKYVDSFDRFDKGAEGNFLVLTFDIRPGETVTFTSATDGKPVDVTKDRYLIYKITKGKNEMKFKVSKGGNEQEVTYDISKLTLMPKDGVGG